MSPKTPSIRKDLDFFPLELEGQRLVMIRDHLGLVAQGKAVAPHLFQFMALLNGVNTTRDLQMELMRQRGGVLVGLDEVERLLARLDEAYLLDSPNFQRARQKLVATFKAQRTRTAALAGQSYPAEASALRKWLDEILAEGGDPPALPGEILALAAPHIDPATGRAVYAQAYKRLARAAPNRVILLGTGHHLTEAWFSLTDKDFAIPLGLVRSDAALVAELRRAGGEAVAPDDFAHRAEHSLEFQLLFLQHLLPPDSFSIIPILCGFPGHMLPGCNRDIFRRNADDLLAKLRDLIRPDGPKTLVVAGVDLSHIGPKFGHDQPARFLEEKAKAHDQALLGHLCAGDPESFWEESLRAQHRYNVCGFSALACLGEILPPCQGKVLAYQMQPEPATDSAVSFAALAFWA